MLARSQRAKKTNAPRSSNEKIAAGAFFSGLLKEFKRIALRADKTDRSFEAVIYLCSAVINSR
jgi:transposase